jgi:ABC-type multidrug transport system fused ATPase/permease subunit
LNGDMGDFSTKSLASDVSDIAPLLQDDEEFERDVAVTSWRKLRKRVRIARRGSVLHRNSERGDHLRRLFLKRRISEAIINSMTVTEVASNRPSTNVKIPQSLSNEGFELSVPSEDMQKWDELFIQELRAEVELEMDKDTESAKIREINNIGKEFQESLKGYDEFPLEVRLNNVTYTVPVDEAKKKIMTVYNASCLYPAIQAGRRLWNRERKANKVVGSKNVLTNISLVLKPGRQYLVLGPPRSGKSTLLRAIAGLVHPNKDERMEGSISYNGRTLAVRTV